LRSWWDRNSGCASSCALIVCLPAILAAQDPREIVRRSVEIDRKNLEIARNYTYLQRQEVARTGRLRQGQEH
jgi:hypothetical protein